MVHDSRCALFAERAITASWQEQGWSLDPDRSRYRDAPLVVRHFLMTHTEPIQDTAGLDVRFRISRIGRTSVVGRAVSRLRPQAGS
ncbi:hypothetical protein GCM10010425_79600 [Streptomyces spororaveus]|uniref:Uncharacterized protein n=1 Tax=Streptomyces spororaveus TaxID=284039 RepID=A0ABQ3T5P6_9ACTN|nr:hypothetical protein Sspor_12450 [Streptomyces spororaveus]